MNSTIENYKCTMSICFRTILISPLLLCNHYKAHNFRYVMQLQQALVDPGQGITTQNRHQWSFTYRAGIDVFSENNTSSARALWMLIVNGCFV
jgi:hypothetical protein